MASKLPFPNGRACASARTAVTRLATLALANTAAASSAAIHQSAATTWTPYSRARKTDVAPLPEPKSRTCIPGRRSRSRARSSSSHNGFGPMSRSSNHAGSYRDERGYRSGRASSSIAVTAPIKMDRRPGAQPICPVTRSH